MDEWQKVLCARLTKLRYQTGQRILIHAPPQYGKTILVSHALPAWLLGLNPRERYRQLCYNVTHATRQTETVAKIISSPEYRNLFPNTVLPKVYGAGEWSTTAQEEIPDAQASALAMGLGSGSGGVGSKWWFIDDPYASREDAYSPTINNKIWDWLNADILARIERDANVVMPFHRHKDNDLAGRCIEQGGWEEIVFSARGGQANDPMGRFTEYAALSPRKHTLEELDKVEKEISPSIFAGLYEGRPRARDGELYKRMDLYGEELSNIVSDFPRDSAARCRYWDRAASESRMADRTASVCESRDARGLFTNESIIAGRWQPTERDELIVRIAKRDREIFGIDNEPFIKIEKQIGQGGKEADEILGRKLAGFSFTFDAALTNKGARNQPFQSQVKSRNMRWVNDETRRKLWGDYEIPLEDCFDECCAFAPDEKGNNAGHDDVVDCLSGSHNHIAQDSYRLF